MKNGRLWRTLAAFGLLVSVEIAAVVVISAALVGPAAAQFLEERFPNFFDRRRQWNPNFYSPGQEVQRAPTVDYSRAPAPKKTDATPLTSVLVLGDSMADWLAYGLETAAAESPDIGIMRKHRTQSGLIRQDVRNDPRGENSDWPQAAREILTPTKANFVVMMIGLNDRRPIRDQAPAKPATPSGAQQPNPQASQSEKPKASQPEPDEKPLTDEPPSLILQAAEPAKGGVHEFRTEKWTELYTKRIDETIAALKSKNVPVFWVGLPPIRGTKSSSDLSYLNELYRSRAERAGITYIDVWDGFVDEQGRFVVQGPDFEGQIRRLRAGDGVHFTQAGARKLAHYVEREIQRAMVAKATTVALPVPDEPVPKTAPVARPGVPVPRPLAGPVVPLADGNDANELLGGGAVRQTMTDAIATRLLIRGETVPIPAGRADDFAWPRRAVAPVGADPVVATTTVPMTPMQSAERPPAPGGTATAPVAGVPGRPAGAAQQPAPGAPKPPGATAQARQIVPQQVRQYFFPFFGR